MSAARIVAAVVLVALGVLSPELARACAVCVGKDDASFTWAMLKGTALLSLTPLAVIGGGVWYLRRRAREIAAREDVPADRGHRVEPGAHAEPRARAVP